MPFSIIFMVTGQDLYSKINSSAVFSESRISSKASLKRAETSGKILCDPGGYTNWVVAGEVEASLWRHWYKEEGIGEVESS